MEKTHRHVDYGRPEDGRLDNCQYAKDVAGQDDVSMGKHLGRSVRSLSQRPAY